VGAGFVNSSHSNFVRVRFANPSNSAVTAVGKFIDTETVECATPDMRSLGSTEVSISVSFNGQQFSSAGTGAFSNYNPLVASSVVPASGPLGGNTTFVVTVPRLVNTSALDVFMVDSLGSAVSLLDCVPDYDALTITCVSPASMGAFLVAGQGYLNFTIDTALDVFKKYSAAPVLLYGDISVLSHSMAYMIANGADALVTDVIALDLPFTNETAIMYQPGDFTTKFPTAQSVVTRPYQPQIQQEVWTITNPSAVSLVAAVAVITLNTIPLIAGLQMRSDCADISLRTTSDFAEMPHWVDSSSCGSQATDIFVKLDVPALSSLNVSVLYGDLNDTTTDGSADGVFATHFPLTRVDFLQWVYPKNSSRVVYDVSDISYLTLNGKNWDAVGMKSVDVWTAPVAFEVVADRGEDLANCLEGVVYFGNGNGVAAAYPGEGGVRFDCDDICLFDSAGASSCISCPLAGQSMRRHQRVSISLNNTGIELALSATSGCGRVFVPHVVSFPGTVRLYLTSAGANGAVFFWIGVVPYAGGSLPSLKQVGQTSSASHFIHSRDIPSTVLGANFTIQIAPNGQNFEVLETSVLTYDVLEAPTLSSFESSSESLVGSSRRDLIHGTNFPEPGTPVSVRVGVRNSTVGILRGFVQEYGATRVLNVSIPRFDELGNSTYAEGSHPLFATFNGKQYSTPMDPALRFVVTSSLACPLWGDKFENVTSLIDGASNPAAWDTNTGRLSVECGLLDPSTSNAAVVFDHSGARELVTTEMDSVYGEIDVSF
jgi:hypothetical protein